MANLRGNSIEIALEHYAIDHEGDRPHSAQCSKAQTISSDEDQEDGVDLDKKQPHRVEPILVASSGETSTMKYVDNEHRSTALHRLEDTASDRISLVASGCEDQSQIQGSLLSHPLRDLNLGKATRSTLAIVALATLILTIVAYVTSRQATSYTKRSTEIDIKSYTVERWKDCHNILVS